MVTDSSIAAKPGAGRRVLPRLSLLVLLVATVFAFAPTLANEFVGWDDVQNLVRNDKYLGLSPAHLKWMFTTAHGGHYQALSWLSFALESRLWGVSSVGFHFTSLVLHILTAIGLFYIARRLIRIAIPDCDDSSATLGALGAALLFAVHPLRVESVAWATERRDVLSGVWLMATTLCYLKHVELRRIETGRSRLWLVLALVCYVLSLLSKAIGVTWPVVLLILDIYPLRRFARENRRRILGEKLVFCVPATVIAALAVWAQHDIGAMRSLEQHPLGLRIAQAFFGIVFYLWKTVWPYPLLPLYEQSPDAAPLDLANVFSAALVLLVTVAFFALRRRRPAWLTTWVLYVVLLAPVLGLAQSGPQVVADRYTYLPSMAWAVLIGAGIAGLCRLDKQHRSALCRPVSLAFVTLCVALVFLARGQTRVWRDTYALWGHVLKHAPDTGMANTNMAILLIGDGKYEQARVHASRCLRRLPGNRSAHIAHARASLALGDLTAAEEHFKIALEIRPDDPPRLINLADVHHQQGRVDEAEALCRKAIDLEPDNVDWRYTLAVLIASEGRYEESVSLFEDAIRVAPDHAESYFREGVVLSELGEYTRAIETLEAGLERAPRHNMIYQRLAWLLATCPLAELRDGPRAVQLASIAVRDSRGRNLLAREALAAAFARTGAFDQAVAVLEQLLAEFGTALNEESKRRVDQELATYRSGRPYEENR